MTNAEIASAADYHDAAEHEHDRSMPLAECPRCSRVLALMMGRPVD